MTRVDHRFNWPAPPEYRPLYGPEVGAGDTRPVPLQVPPTRILEQTFSYDYLGNLTNTWDDQNASYDRSLGDITHGSAIDGPNQIRSAPGVTARHDAAGNLVELKIERSGYCLHPSGSRCAQWFAYDWDEVGQLARARRWDFESTLPALPSGTLPSQTPSWDLHYGYSMGVRVLKSATDGVGPERHQVDVFDSLRLADAAFDTFWQPEDYQRDRDTMQVFLAGGMARVFYDGTTSLPRAPGQDYRHVYLQIGDHLGSSTAVIELATGELVERTTHTAYGAIESDHRPSRWHEASEPLKFTGKEEDIEVGLTYFGARYYAPRLGRWASADPLTIHGLGSDLNPYAYVRGRVMSHVDPFGLADHAALAAVDGAKAEGLRNPPPGSTYTYVGVYADRAEAWWTGQLEVLDRGTTPTHSDPGLPVAGANLFSHPPEALHSAGQLKSGYGPREATVDAVLFLTAVLPEVLGLAEAGIWAGAARLLGTRTAAGAVVTGEIGAVAAGTKELKAPFNPLKGQSNCVQAVIAFLRSVTMRTLVTARPDAAYNGGRIATANGQIAAQAGVRISPLGQQSTLMTTKPIQFFIVYPGSNASFAKHVLIGMNIAGRTLLYDPQSGEKFADVTKYGAFIAFPIALGK